MADAYVGFEAPSPSTISRYKFYKVNADGSRGALVATTPDATAPTDGQPFKISGLPIGTTQLEVTAYLDGNSSQAPAESAGVKFPVTLVLQPPVNPHQV
jgi:hypothetical protein